MNFPGKLNANRTHNLPARVQGRATALRQAASALAGLAGVALILYCTVWGAGLVDDSFIYITSAQNLVAGNGLSVLAGDGTYQPMSHYPPLFPLVLAAFQIVGIDAAIAARLFNALAFGLSLILMGRAAERVTGAHWLAWVGPLLWLSSDVLIELHAWAMSEPLYLLLALLGFYLLANALDRSGGGGLAQPGQKWPGLLLAGFVLGLGFLTRYLGAALVLTGLLVLVAYPGEDLKRRLAHAAGFAAAALLPMAAWGVRNLVLTGGLADRPAELHGITLNQLRNGLNTLLLWLLPGRIVHEREFLLAGVLLAAAVGLAWLYRRWGGGESFFSHPRPGTALRRILAFYAVVHVILLLLSKSFFDPITPLNDRLLSPLLPVFWLLGLAWVTDLWRMEGSRAAGWVVRLAALATLLVIAGLAGSRALDLAPRLHATGLGFARKGWHNSDTLATVRRLPEGPLFSNAPSALMYWTGRPAYPIYDLDLLRRQMAEQAARLVVFNSVSLALYDVTAEELLEGLAPVETFQDGTIYEWAQK